MNDQDTQNFPFNCSVFITQSKNGTVLAFTNQKTEQNQCYLRSCLLKNLKVEISASRKLSLGIGTPKISWFVNYSNDLPTLTGY